MKKTILTILLMSILITMVACENKPTLAEVQHENEIMASIIKEDEAKIKSLEDTLKSLYGDVKTAIGSIGDGTDKLTFNSINKKIVFAVPFEYTGSTQAPNTAKLNISENVSIVPSSNWLIKVTGTSAEFNHPSGISGIIKVGSIEKAVPAEEIQDTIFKPFLASIPNGNATYGKLFLGNNSWGNYATITTTINTKPALLKAGALGIGNISVVYMFCYDGETDVTKDELIDVLVRTMKVNNQQLSYN